MDKIYMVWREDGDLPKATHEFLTDAQDEAKRLAKKHPGVQFHVVGTIDLQKEPEERIEVGDVVTASEKFCIQGCELLSHDKKSGRVAMHSFNNDGCACISTIGHLTLVRKGPAKHVFEGVKIIEKNGYAMPAKPINGMSYSYPLAMLDADGKTYRMTLEEME